MVGRFRLHLNLFAVQHRFPRAAWNRSQPPQRLTLLSVDLAKVLN
jgi:hypothetical protein